MSINNPNLGVIASPKPDQPRQVIGGRSRGLSPEGAPNLAQGNALGKRTPTAKAPEGSPTEIWRNLRQNNAVGVAATTKAAAWLPHSKVGTLLIERFRKRAPRLLRQPRLAQRAITACAALLLLLALSIFSSAVQAQEAPSVEEIVKKAKHISYYQGKDGTARVKMTITDGQGRIRNKEFSILRLDKDDKDADQAFYVFFHAPADEAGTVFMVWKHEDRDDDRWLYLPGLDVTKRIAASDERTSFVGSHFFYEDVSGRGIDEDTHELVETNANYYVLKNTPKKPDTVEFDSYTVWIHKATFLPVKAAFKKDGKTYRTVTVEDVKTIDGYKTVTKSRVTDTNIGGNTVIEYSDVKYDLGLPEDIFTERHLRKPPREYFK